MWKDLSASWAILLGIGCMMLANGLQGTLLGVRAGVEGFSTFTTGIMMSGYFVGIFIGLQVDGWNDERKERIREITLLEQLYIDFDNNGAIVGSMAEFHAGKVAEICGQFLIVARLVKS